MWFLQTWLGHDMCSLLENNSELTREQVEQNCDGNLCRCTGYRPILRTIVLWQAHHHSQCIHLGDNQLSQEVLLLHFGATVFYEDF